MLYKLHHFILKTIWNYTFISLVLISVIINRLFIIFMFKVLKYQCKNLTYPWSKIQHDVYNKWIFKFSFSLINFATLNCWFLFINQYILFLLVVWNFNFRNSSFFIPKEQITTLFIDFMLEKSLEIISQLVIYKY